MRTELQSGCIVVDKLTNTQLQIPTYYYTKTLCGGRVKIASNPDWCIQNDSAMQSPLVGKRNFLSDFNNGISSFEMHFKGHSLALEYSIRINLNGSLLAEWSRGY